MLVYIHPSIGDAIREDGDDASLAITVLELLAMAYREGKHIVCGDALALREIAGTHRLSEMARGTLRKIASKCSEANGFRSQLPFSIEVGRGTEFLNQVESRGSTRILRLDVRWLDDSSRVQRAVMVTENLSDSELYSSLAAAFATARRWKVRIALDRRGGGGSTLAQTLDSLASERLACICIVDSDKISPASSLGETARHVLKVDTVPGWQHVIITEVREVENLIPLTLIEDALGIDASLAAERHHDLQRVGAAAAWYYADLKNGTRLSCVQKLPATSPARLFWDGIEAKARALAEVRSDRCNDPVECTVERCGCFLVLGFGDAMLSRVSEYLLTVSSHRIAQRAGLDDRRELAQLCSEIIAFGCALPASST